MAGRALVGWRRDLLAELGGESAVSPQQMALVEDAARTYLYLNHIDAILLEQRSLVKKRELHPLVVDRLRVADHLARILDWLGLDRREPKPLDLNDYIKQRYGGRPDPTGQTAEADGTGEGGRST